MLFRIHICHSGHGLGTRALELVGGWRRLASRQKALLEVFQRAPTWAKPPQAHGVTGARVVGPKLLKTSRACETSGVHGNAKSGRRSIELEYFMTIVPRIKARLRGTWPHRVYERVKVRNELAKWEASGRPVPPPHAIKARCVLAVADLIGASTLVETGTHYGAMLEATRHRFRLLHSIELDAGLTATAKLRFAGRNHIHIHQGDSATVLPSLIAQLPSDPVVFWLDGHYSGPGTAKGNSVTPILQELAVIAGSRGKRDAIIIDDVRLFGGDPAYPTLAALRKNIAERFGGSAFVTPYDAMVILPPPSIGQ